MKSTLGNGWIQSTDIEEGRLAAWELSEISNHAMMGG